MVMVSKEQLRQFIKENNLKATDNSRNGHSRKTLNSEYGDVEIAVPRDRKGEFEPQIIKKPL